MPLLWLRGPVYAAPGRLRPLQHDVSGKTYAVGDRLDLDFDPAALGSLIRSGAGVLEPPAPAP